MNAIDWATPATLQRRDDSGSDMFVAFEEVARGSLSDMIARVAAMPPQDRARVVLDVPSLGMLDIARVMELAARPDFPAG